MSSVEDAAPKPRAHGASVANVLNDLAPSDADAPAGQRDTLYADAVRYWRENVESHENEPYPATEFDAEWLPETAGEWVLLVKSSGWKAGTGYGDDYSQYYEQHIMLRERVETDDGVELRKPPLALHVEVMPQYRDLVFKSGDPLECPYGEGTRVVCWTTWAESGSEVERRMYDAIRAVYGDDVLDAPATGTPTPDASRKPKPTTDLTATRRGPSSRRSNSQRTSSRGAGTPRSTHIKSGCKRVGWRPAWSPTAGIYSGSRM
ncbi:hypothetical protein ACFQRB_00215 [Halobaculum litoreum]|uniref:Uncharacterized protein n=1 Tax=Halobaculum litoreum TaxID=3031998 RepID=A0ABD5XP65_9EURY